MDDILKAELIHINKQLIQLRTRRLEDYESEILKERNKIKELESEISDWSKKLNTEKG